MCAFHRSQQLREKFEELEEEFEDEDSEIQASPINVLVLAAVCRLLSLGGGHAAAGFHHASRRCGNEGGTP